MREIKFRVWDKILKGFSKNTMNFYHNDGIVSPEIGDRFIFLQYIGLRDKHEKEIYEGDIVKISGDSNISDGNYSIKWHELASFALYRIENNYTLSIGKSILENIEIIGNIYQNDESNNSRK